LTVILRHVECRGAGTCFAKLSDDAAFKSPAALRVNVAGRMSREFNIKRSISVKSALRATCLIMSSVFLMITTIYGQGLDIKEMGPGLHKMEATHPDGTLQRYVLNVPETYDGKTAVPMILGLHYGFRGVEGTERPEPYWAEGFFTKIYQQAFEPLNAIFVAADSVNGNWSTAENETAVLRLMDSIIATYNIDAKKTIITGYSMGGFGTWYMASKYQERFAGALPIAGMPADMDTYRESKKLIDVDWKIPLYIIHSRVDGLIDIAPTEEYVKQLKADGKDVTFHVLEVITHHQEDLLPEPMGKAVPWIQNIWKNVK